MTPTRKGKKRTREEPDELDELLAGDQPPKLRADGWPESVPVLVERDVTWNWTTADGRRDLGEWLEVTFDTAQAARHPRRDKAYKVLCEVLTERFRKKVSSLWLFLEFTHKHRIPCLAWQAACWNEMLRRLGYDVPKRSTKDPGFKPSLPGR